jgi:hypothetical protein
MVLLDVNYSLVNSFLLEYIAANLTFWIPVDFRVEVL